MFGHLLLRNVYLFSILYLWGSFWSVFASVISFIIYLFCYGVSKFLITMEQTGVDPEFSNATYSFVEAYFQMERDHSFLGSIEATMNKTSVPSMNFSQMWHISRTCLNISSWIPLKDCLIRQFLHGAQECVSLTRFQETLPQLSLEP